MTKKTHRRKLKKEEDLFTTAAITHFELTKKIKRYDKLILNKPDYAEAYYNRGVLFVC
jgi:hypothetical protein